MRMDRHCRLHLCNRCARGHCWPELRERGQLCVPRRRRRRFWSLLAWAREHGAKIHPHIAVAHFESALKTQDGRQIVATRAIANESALLEIPSALHMSVKQLRAHALLGKPRLSFSLSLIPTVLFLVV
jgi:hypothetical protein